MRLGVFIRFSELCEGTEVMKGDILIFCSIEDRGRQEGYSRHQLLKR
jgi:hypothetical protein